MGSMSERNVLTDTDQRILTVRGALISAGVLSHYIRLLRESLEELPVGLDGAAADILGFWEPVDIHVHCGSGEGGR